MAFGRLEGLASEVESQRSWLDGVSLSDGRGHGGYHQISLLGKF